MAIHRGMSTATIINHLSVLKEENPDIDLDKFMPNENTLLSVKDALEKITKRANEDDFSQDGKPRLKPIYEVLDSKVEYYEIRVALLQLG